jgi:hypothetical protein
VPNNTTLAIRNLLEFFAPELGEPTWPPDVFALVAMLLHKSGAYTRVVDSWPPPCGVAGDPRTAARAWVEEIRDIGARWRELAADDNPPPLEVAGWWSIVLHYRDTPVKAISDTDELWQALLQLIAAADEASRGVGIPSPPPVGGATPIDDRFDQRATELLLAGHSLGWKVDPSRVSILPKLHTPQNGMTIRSLSHNLALCLTGDVNAKWFRLAAPRMQRCLNLLLVPWPSSIRPKQFKQVEGGINNMPPGYGFFEYAPGSAEEAMNKLETLYTNAEHILGKGEIDGVIFPELSLDQATYDTVRHAIAAGHKSLLIAGVSDQAIGANYLAMDIPIADGRVVAVGPQHKHHRWRIEKSQILQYGLGSSLDPAASLWENIQIRERNLAFVSMRPWLTLCTLICEDLARQDPVADLLRSVAPNLVIALLMDGPQLVSRWPARYATVLADDPGSSVLTLTSLGMATLCRPKGSAESRCIALWKDARSGGPVEIELPHGAEAVVLSLSTEFYPEWTADGRDDYGTTGYPILAGVYPVTGG